MTSTTLRPAATTARPGAARRTAICVTGFLAGALAAV